MSEISIKEMLRSGDSFLRRDACEAVADSRDSEYLNDIVLLLSDEELSVREAAIAALTNIGGAEVGNAVVPLLRLDDATQRNIAIEILAILGLEVLDIIMGLFNDPDDDVVKFAVDIIAQMTMDEPTVKRIAPLIEHSNPNVRASVAVCLGMSNAPGVLKILLTALEDPEEWVKFSVIEGLGLVGDKAALSPLFKIIETETGLTQEAAFDAVGKIASCEDAVTLMPRVTGLLEDEKFLPLGAVLELMEKAMAPGSTFKPDTETKKVLFRFFSSAVDDTSLSRRLQGLRGLSTLKLTDGLEKVFDFADSLPEIDEETGPPIVDTIVSIVGGGSLPAVLVEEVNKCNRNLAPIVQALGLLKGTPETCSAIEALLKHVDGHSRKAAARAYVAIKGEEAVPLLLEYLKVEKYRDVMEEITDQLAMLPSEAVKNGFCEMIDNGTDAQRVMGARGLGMLAQEGSLDCLKNAVADEVAEVRQAAYRSLAMLGSEDSIQLVLNGFSDPDDDVRLTLIKGLSGWPIELIMPALLTAIKDENVWVRYHAVTLLGDNHQEESVPILIERLKEDEPPVQAAAAFSLERLEATEAVEELTSLLEHPDHNVTAAVERALETLVG
jgi:HEAT repeat protein